MKNIAILGSTGSIGRQAVEVALHQGWHVDLLSAHTSIQLLEEQVRLLHPTYCAVTDEASGQDLKVRIQDTSTQVLIGLEGLLHGIASCDCEVYINAILGMAGLKPTLACMKTGKRLALANKESLVIAGHLVKEACDTYGAKLIPVDSEHSAIFQCLHGGQPKEVKKLLLTASGGPFFGYSQEQLEKVTLEDTLRHPTWNMGKKITVDSATMMNKGFEMMEAAHLFSVPIDHIEVLVHRESVVHSAVEFCDHTVLAELSKPDMRICIQHAVTYPERVPGLTEELDLFSYGTLSFYPPDEKAFPLLALAKKAYILGGGVPCVLNAINEVAVEAFLQKEISFNAIARNCIQTIDQLKQEAQKAQTLEELLELDLKVRSVYPNQLAK